MVESLKTSFKFVLDKIASTLCVQGRRRERDALSKRRINNFDTDANLESLEPQHKEKIAEEDDNCVHSDDAFCESDCSHCYQKVVERKTKEFYTKLKRIESGDNSRLDSFAEELEGQHMLTFRNLTIVDTLQ